MNYRISAVQHMKVISLDRTSVLEIGDSVQLSPTSQVIAIQREKSTFWENELNFSDYAMFTEEIPQPHVDENIKITIVNQVPMIRVQTVNIENIASSTIIHLGSSENLVSEARVKNIRHLLRAKD